MFPQTPRQYDAPETCCECKPCWTCDGEGSFGQEGNEIFCSDCGGSGIDNSLCEVHVGELAPKRLDADDDGRYEAADAKLTAQYEECPF